MDVKDAFDYISKSQFLIRKIDLSINTDLMIQTKSFFTNRKIQLVINRYNNKKRDIETRILQGLLVLPILFLIYISGVFKTITKNNPPVTSLSFIYDLGFIAVETLAQEIFKTLETMTLSVADSVLQI